MANFEETLWGRSLPLLDEGPVENPKEVVYSAGVNELYPHCIIPLHLHLEDREEYIPQTGGLKVLVLTQEEAETLSGDEMMERLRNLETCEKYDVVNCKKGYAHMAYNDSDEVTTFIFRKYKEVQTEA